MSAKPKTKNSWLQLITDGAKTFSVPGGKVDVFKNFSFGIKAGEATAVMAPNASGKSVFTRVLLGLETLDSGTLEFSLSDRDILGFVTQRYQEQLLLTQSVRTNLLIATKGLRDPGINPQELIEASLDFFKVLGYDIKLNSVVGTLSGGQQQAIVLARAFSAKSAFCIWDEPTSAIDMTRKRSLYKYIEQIRKSSNQTLLFITHDDDEALAIADRVVVFEPGLVVLYDKQILRPVGMDGWTYAGSQQAKLIKDQLRDAMCGKRWS